MASDFRQPRDEREAKQHQLVGAINMTVWLLTGGLDAMASELLGSTESQPPASVPYMPLDHFEGTEEHTNGG